jgi:acetyl esterase/lipase
MWVRLFLALYAIAIGTKVLFRRLFRGPKRPGWGFLFEATIEIARGIVRRGASRLNAGQGLGVLSVPVAPADSRRVSFERKLLAELPTEVHTPASFAPGEPTILYLHGGGYVTCSPATHRELTRRLAIAAGARVYVPDYRKAPAHVFPAQVDDAVACYRELLASGVSPRTLFIGGDSAGGGLCLALLQRLREANETLPCGVLLLSPWVDLECTGETLLKHAEYDYLAGDLVSAAAKIYAAQTDLTHPHISPLKADLRGMPPMIVQTGGAEVFMAENVAFVELARSAGVDITHEITEHMVHVFQAFVLVSPEGNKAIQSLGRFVRERAGLAMAPAAEVAAPVAAVAQTAQ